jgi:hypothetical protein
MKRRLSIRTSVLSVFVGMMGLLLPGQSYGTQATLTDDATVISKKSSSTGSDKSLRVVGPLTDSSDQEALLKFDLSTLPAGATSSNIAKATLTLFVSKVQKAGTFDVVAVTGTWNEATVTFATAPSPTEVEAAGVDVAQNDFVAVDLTGLVKDWVDGVTPNNGIALIPNGTGVDVQFDSKEIGRASCRERV